MKTMKPLRWTLFWSAAIAGLIVSGPAAAQESPAVGTPSAAPQPPKKSTAQDDAGEPRASTSPPASGATGPPPSSAPVARGAPAASGKPETGKPADGKPADGKPADGALAEGKAAAGSQSARASNAPGQKKPGGVDRLELNTATVTGDREQPKVMYIVPWKSSDIGDLSGKPMNSLLDEALAPVDRDEFKREVVYFNAVKADGSQNGTSAGTPKQGEK